MNRKPLTLLGLVFLFALNVSFPWHSALADDSDGYDENGNKKSYYWQGAQLNNLGRLGNPGDFEEVQRRAHEGKDPDQYLSTIREQMAHKAKLDAQNKAALTFQGQLPANPIELTYLSPGLRVTLHANALFDENSATIKAGAVDILEHLNQVLETEQQKPLQFVISDAVEEDPDAANLDAERSLVVLSMLAFAAKDTNQENLNPETLTR